MLSVGEVGPAPQPIAVNALRTTAASSFMIAPTFEVAHARRFSHQSSASAWPHNGWAAMGRLVLKSGSRLPDQVGSRVDV
jgi:hypothetical protein